MDAYFFIPGNRLHKLDFIQKMAISEIIIDLEDAVKVSEREEVVRNLIAQEAYRKFYLRVPLYSFDNNIDTTILKTLTDNGFNKFVFPKVENATDFDRIYNAVKTAGLKIILLIETPRLFLEVKEVLLKYPELFTGLGMGSHDFMARIGGLHNFKNLEYARQHLLYMARMIDIIAIDIASMELKSEKELQDEIVDGFEKGYDAKFYIHPWQIEVKNQLLLYTNEDLAWARAVKEALRAAGTAAEFSPVVLNGQIIERPHLYKAEKIIKYYETK